MKGPEGADVVCAREVEGRRREDKLEAKTSLRNERWFILESSEDQSAEGSFS